LLVAVLAQAVLYRGPIFEHYFVALAPLAFLGLGATLAAVPSRFALAFAMALLAVNLWRSPLLWPPLDHLARTSDVAHAVAARAAAEPFGLWLMAADDTDGAYRYQLTRLGLSPARPEDPLPRQLFVVCQDPPCDLSQLQRTAGPDWSAATLAWQDRLDGVTVLELRRQGP
jgi:hypothetical protein